MLIMVRVVVVDVLYVGGGVGNGCLPFICEWFLVP